jgi:hypothetical protein
MNIFGFDAGTPMHVIDKKVIGLLDSHFSDTGLDIYVTTGTGTKTINKIMSLDQMKLGTDRVESVEFLVQDITAFNQSMIMPISGVLSLTSLESRVIVIDIEQKRIYFEIMNFIHGFSILFPVFGFIITLYIIDM